MIVVDIMTTWNDMDYIVEAVRHAKSHADQVVVCDNMGSDGTMEYAREQGCTIVQYDTGGELRDDILLSVKNTVHRLFKADWYIVHDVDEFIHSALNDYTVRQLLEKYLEEGITCVRALGLNMVGEEKTNGNFRAARRGVHDPHFNKLLAFRSGVEPNYEPGCHMAYPSGQVNYAPFSEVWLLHYKWALGIDRLLRYCGSIKTSQINRENNWGWDRDEPELMRQYYEHIQQEAVAVL